MAGLSDSLTIGILLILVFGAVSFYLYSRMGQNEKRLGLLENLLLTLKMSTEASLAGPDMVEAVSGASPLQAHDVDNVNEEEYADMLKEVSSLSSASPSANVSAPSNETEGDAEAEAEAEAEALLRSMTIEKTPVNVNYESMTVKELRGLANERGLSSVLTKKKELVDALKRGPAAVVHTPLLPSHDELEGSEKVEGFAVNLQE